MPKTRINVCIDLDLALTLKTMPDLNISRTVNEFLRQFTRVDEMKGEEGELLEQQKVLREKQFSIQEQLTKVSADIMIVRAAKEKEFKQKTQAHDEFVKSGLMRTIR